MEIPCEFDSLVAEGLTASRAGRKDEALALFGRARELDPASGLPHFLIASEQASAGDFVAAELSFASAVLLAPDFPLARYQLGLLQFSSQRAPLALLTWQPLFSLAETDPLLHFVRGFSALAQDAFAEALHHFRIGLDCKPANPALCSDVQQLVAAVEALQQRDTPGSGGEGEVEPAATHVLLSGYARGLH